MIAARQQMLSKPAPAYSLMRSGHLQRKGAFGSHTLAGAECEECGKKQTLQRDSLSPRGREAEGKGEVLPIAPKMLHTPDHPLNGMEPQFGHDFSQIQVHGKAADSLADARSSTVSRDGDVETQTQALGAPPIVSTPGVSANHCALTAANFTSIPSGTVAATLTGGRLQAPFVMRATFENPVPCNCSNGEYRQFVRGSFTAGGKPVTHMLGPGRPMSATAFQEDGDVAAGTVYGHRSVLGTKSRFLPDQQGGCQFEGEDEPGISSSSGTVVTMNLDFRGDLIDTSASNRVLNTSSWTVSGSATMP